MKRIILSVAALLAFSNGSASGQDQFGRAVAVGEDGTVFVLKPVSGRGPATLYAYRRSADGEWSLSSKLRAPGAENSQAGLSPSISVQRDEVLVAAGDSEVIMGAYAFRRRQGEWAPAGTLALRDTPPPRGADARGIDFGEVLRILSPPPRVVALDGDWAVVGAPGAGPEAGRELRVFHRSATGWSHHSNVAAPQGNTDPRFGAALAVAGGELFASSPADEGGGAVYRFVLDGAEWVPVARLSVDSMSAGARFGESMALDGGRLLVGAPGAHEDAGRAFLFHFPSADSPLPDTLWPETDEGGQLFGSGVALRGDRVLVGAPGAREWDLGGVVYLFPAGDGTRLRRQGLQPVVRFGEPGARLGASVALGDDFAVMGSPGSDGNGSVSVWPFGDGPGPFSAPHELRPDVELQAHRGGEVRCAEGTAAGFDCDGVDLLAFLPLSEIGAAPGEQVSDVWGWTDPETGREYALLGRDAGAALIDVTDPSHPAYLGLVRAPASGARDLKVYADHLFFTGDGAGKHGLIVFDLTRLREGARGEFEPDAVYDGIWSAHNLVIDTESGFAYPVGASGGGQTCGGGLHMVDVRNPKNPVFAGCFTDTEGLIWQGRTHDAQCVVYRGPDLDYAGRQICFASNETAMRILDVTDKNNPTPVGTATYPGLAYVHQGWLTDDHRYYYLDDELDELVGTTERTRTFIYDVAELDDPILVGSVDGPNGSTDHNLYVKGDRMYQANYQAGFRLFDVSDPEAPVEIGWFDTTPYEGNPPGFVGAWTAFPYLESGTVLVSSMNEGLFLLKPQRRELIP